ncbi:PREDICTED: SH2 domain-containing protein 7-like isoform X1 [Cyprinodon variegatus]|uniref:SH2 domain-containing protein 7-like n=2 Tax=Cyprinodon variegatus TaxID=28743 RepID=A0A3Q2DGU4_CYPVA|nr:PREDICTED: SH2 domain-containing protein 7-like isoform X1 [Cyprinodon variegatus]XP_015252773.1 PREDICTED: SH2 domain-containing protein 7-like isoform X1 [Cyprinodon variegatus]
MFAAMTPGSNHTLAFTRTGFERNCCGLCQHQKSRSENICYFSHSRPREENHTKSPGFRTRVKFCFKDRLRMEQRERIGDPAAEVAEGKLKDLASKWFIDTQLPLIVNNGLFPNWFLGFISRRDAEDMLREKEFGCFLIRLSDKAIGYILSYKGRDRCRHFVISQSESGQFAVCGDTEGHNTMFDLIEHYKTKPIEPFGEYLTSPCFGDLSEDLYDTIKVAPKEKPEAPLRPVKKVHKQQINPVPEHHPMPVPRSNRTQEEGPPLPRRTRPVESNSVSDNDGVLYAQLRKQTPRDAPRARQPTKDRSPGKAGRLTSKENNNGRSSPPSDPESVYSELSMLDSKSKSLPLLDNSSDSELCYRLSVPPDTPPRLSPRPVRPASSSISQSNSSHSLDDQSDHSIYHLAGGHSPTPSENASSTEHLSDSLYAEVSIEGPVIDNDGTYEILPDHKEPAKPKASSNTYDPEETKRKSNTGSWGIKNDKWKWLFPEMKKK